MRRTRLLAGVLAALAATACASVASPAVQGGRGSADVRVLSGDESPWPRTSAPRANVRAIKAVVRALEGETERMELSAARYGGWDACLRGVPVSEYGDPERQSGYGYDGRDGTGRSFMPALAVDRESRPRREDYLFLGFSRTAACRTTAPEPGGTAEAAAVRASAPPRDAASAPARTSRTGRSAHGARPARSVLRDLERRVRAIKRSSRALLASSERFDAWESCVSWVPVTEYGDPDGGFGFLFGGRGTSADTLAYRAALAIDRSDWDDPDYMFLAHVGGDRPGRGCRDEPGEGVD